MSMSVCLSSKKFWVLSLRRCWLVCFMWIEGYLSRGVDGLRCAKCRLGLILCMNIGVAWSSKAFFASVSHSSLRVLVSWCDRTWLRVGLVPIRVISVVMASTVEWFVSFSNFLGFVLRDLLAVDTAFIEDSESVKISRVVFGCMRSRPFKIACSSALVDDGLLEGIL